MRDEESSFCHWIQVLRWVWLILDAFWAILLLFIVVSIDLWCISFRYSLVLLQQLSDRWQQRCYTAYDWSLSQHSKENRGCYSVGKWPKFVFLFWCSLLLSKRQTIYWEMLLDNLSFPHLARVGRESCSIEIVAYHLDFSTISLS